MTNEHDASRLGHLGLEPSDLDGRTIEELSDYLDAGRTPLDPAIEASAGCQIALDALERLHALTGQLIAADVAEQPEPEPAWIDRILSGIAMDARAGRRIPFASPEPHIDLGITEGAVRGLIRSTEDAFPGVLVGRCAFDGDVTAPGAPIRVEIEVSVPYGEPIPRLVAQLRADIAERLRKHTELDVIEIDVRIRDIQDVRNEGGDR